MQGITPRVDHQATMAMLKHKKNLSAKPDGKNKEGDSQDDSEGKDICKPCTLPSKSYRRLRAIIAGSIRPPNRIMHTNRQLQMYAPRICCYQCNTYVLDMCQVDRYT